MKALRLFVPAVLAFCSCVTHPTPDPARGLAPGTMRVAACQILVEGERAPAMRAVEVAMVRAAELGAQIAVFPETCLYGWINPAAHELADPIPGPASQALGELAQQYGMMIAIGLAEKDGDRLYDSAVLIGADGQLLLKHRKVNVLTEWMDPPYSAGADALHSAVDTRYGRIGLLICADTFDKQAVEELASLKPDLVLVPYGWAAPEADWPGHAQSLHGWIAHTARTTRAPVVGVDAVGSVLAGPMKGQIFGGQSAASGSDGLLLGVLADRKSDVRVFEFELAESRQRELP